MKCVKCYGSKEVPGIGGMNKRCPVCAVPPVVAVAPKIDDVIAKTAEAVEQVATTVKLAKKVASKSKAKVKKVAK